MPQTNQTKKRPRRVTGREWLSLGVLAVQAACAATKAGNKAAATYYNELAKTCDTEAAIDAAVEVL